MEFTAGTQAGRHEERRMQRGADERGQTTSSILGRHLHDDGGHPVAVDGVDFHAELHVELAGVCRHLVAHRLHSRRP